MTILEPLGLAGEAKLKCNTGKVDMSATLYDRGALKLNYLYTTKKSVDCPGFNIRLSGSSRNANMNYLNLY